MRALPKTVGRYRVIAKLGQGGMATALLALSEGPGGFRKLSVVKQLRLDLCEDPDFVAMFLDEARIAALLNHPNVVQTNEVGAEGNIRFISMEYLQGQSLARVLYRVQGRLPLGMHLRVIADALTGLHYVHELTDLSGKELRVVHRDISPGNLFVTYDGAVKVLDFGIAKAEGSRTVTEVGSFKGKMAYVAPEQARAAVVDRRADIFSMGVLLWEALAKRPLVAREEADILSLQNRVKGLEPSIDKVAPDAPKALREVCKKAMALNPDDRYSTAEEYRDALQEAAAGLKGGSQKDLATVMNKLFKKEREAIADTIARTISTKDPFKSDVEMISSWEQSTSMSMRKLVADEAITQELTKDDYSAVEPGSGSKAYPPYEPYSLAEPASQVEISSLASTVMPLANLAKTASYRTAALSIVVLSLVIGFAAYFTGSSDNESETSELPVVTSQDSETEPSPESAAELEPQVEPLPEDKKAPPTIQLALKVEPKSTVLSINGKVLGPSPYTSRHPVAFGDHELVARAPGYETSRQVIQLDEDLSLDFSLKKVNEDLVIEAMELETSKRRNTKKSRDRTSGANQDRDKANRDQKLRRDNTRPDTAGTDTVAVDKKTSPDSTKKSPTPGDSLRRKRDKKTRKIDKDNPYN